MTQIGGPARIAELNDRLRRGLAARGELMVSASVLQRGAGFVDRAIQAASKVSSFDHGKPGGSDHSVGCFELEGEAMCFSIRYLALDAKHGSFDPADPLVTLRTMTIQFADEA